MHFGISTSVQATLVDTVDTMVARRVLVGIDECGDTKSDVVVNTGSGATDDAGLITAAGE